ncbi:MAG: hypothetical protein WA130_21605, partial [Candidatus Methanoperedens sp.]
PLYCGLVSLPPQLHIGPLPDWMWGSVLRRWLTFPHAGFSPDGEYELCSARPCHPCSIPQII